MPPLNVNGMAPGQVMTEPCGEALQDDKVAEETALRHDKALAIVQRRLRSEGVRTLVVHRISIKLLGSGGSYSMGRQRQAPELVVYAAAGWVIASVTLAKRSECFMVSIPSLGIKARLVNVIQPETVVNLILAATEPSRRSA